MARKNGPRVSVGVLLLAFLICTGTASCGSDQESESERVQPFQLLFGGIPRDAAGAVAIGANGDIVLTGYSDSLGDPRGDMFLLALDGAGGKRWLRAIPMQGSQGAGSIAAMRDGGFAVAGSGSNTRGSTSGLVVRTDSTGSLLWSHEFDGAGTAFANAVRQTLDGGLIVVGDSEPPPQPSTLLAPFRARAGALPEEVGVLLVRLSKDGDVLWSRIVSEPGLEDGLRCRSVAATSDGAFVVAGTIEVDPHTHRKDAVLVKVNGDGDRLWKQTFGGETSDSAADVRETADRGLVFVGSTTVRENEDILVLRTDAEGNQLWRTSVGGDLEDAGEAIRQTPDRGFVLVGTSLAPETSSDALLVKLDGAGNQAWSRRFGRPDPETGNDVELAPDGGYVVAAEIGSPVWDGLVIRTDSEGRAPSELSVLSF